MDHVRPHTDHRNIFFAKIKNIRSQIFQGLPRQADHNAGTHLITNGAQFVQTGIACRPDMPSVLWMQGLI